MVGMASAIAHRLVGSFAHSRVLERRDEPCGPAGKALGSHEQPLCHPLDGLFLPVPVFLFPWVRGDRPCGCLLYTSSDRVRFALEADSEEETSE